MSARARSATRAEATRSRPPGGCKVGRPSPGVYGGGAMVVRQQRVSASPVLAPFHVCHHVTTSPAAPHQLPPPRTILAVMTPVAPSRAPPRHRHSPALRAVCRPRHERQSPATAQRPRPQHGERRQGGRCVAGELVMDEEETAKSESEATARHRQGTREVALSRLLPWVAPRPQRCVTWYGEDDEVVEQQHAARCLLRCRRAGEGASRHPPRHPSATRPA